MGACVAVLINVLFPVDPERRIERSARPIFDELATALRETAVALEGANLEKGEQALLQARRVDDRVDDLRGDLEAARDTARLSPARRRTLGRLGYYEVATDHLDLVAPGARTLARASFRLLRGGEPAPKALSEAVLDLSRAVEALAEYLEEPGRPPDDTRQLALGAARSDTALLEERSDLATNALVAQIRSTAVDLLRGTDMDYPEALQALEEEVRREPEPHERPGEDPPTKAEQGHR